MTKEPKATLAEMMDAEPEFDIALAQDLVQVDAADSTRTWILCPWLRQFPTSIGVWMSVLAAHDANDGLLRSLPVSAKSWPRVYAGVFAVDTLRRSLQLVDSLKGSGVAGVINFPSVSFIDGEAGEVLNGLSLGVDREINFLRICSNEGLRVAGVARTIETAERLGELGADFLVAHGGPPTHANEDPSQDAARRFKGAMRLRNLPVIPISRVLNRTQCSD
jgi:hypothetical protein